MNNSLILTVIDLIGKRKTENLIEKGFFNKSTELNEKEILECIGCILYRFNESHMR